MPIVTAQAELPKSAPVEPVSQPDTSIAPVEAPKEAADQISPKFAALARKEKALRSQYQAIKAKEEALKAKELEYQSKYIQKDKLTQDPMAALQELGITYDQLTNLVLNQPKPEELAFQRLQKEIDSVKESQTQTQKNYQEQQTKAYEQAVNQIRNETKVLVDSDQAFETIKETGNVEAVVELIRSTFEDSGTLLTVEEAAKEVEDYLTDEYSKLASLKKVQERLKPKLEQVLEEKQKQSQPSNQLKTLTSSVTGNSSKPMSARDRAVLAFQGKLK